MSGQSGASDVISKLSPQYLIAGSITVLVLLVSAYFFFSSKIKKEAKEKNPWQFSKPDIAEQSLDPQGNKAPQRSLSISSSESDEYSESEGSDSSGTSPFLRSKKKGDQGYYYAHHNTAADGLRPEDFSMDAPKKLETKPQPTEIEEEKTSKPKLTGQQIRQYSWEDAGPKVKIFFMPADWEWSEVEEREIDCVFTKTSFAVQIDSEKYGAHYLFIDKTRSEITDVKVI
eukprot:CAMPEP_0117740770 /NCGR_PEP_ID=MMETSP0947-20121206/4532_1 /TAXON_ID=44440 /ORGANISM="Chattonella subsalsa, Strain CCMP2191" /LENGTH=228 /DNA_ID=CAMNT_0005556933 /DNA_START=252 /DNA_END=935 /DNA_ORIENTATION=+